MGTSYIATAFATLINLLEAYRLEQLKLLAKEKEPVKQLIEAERRESEQFLCQPDLLQRTNELIGQSGVIGEENNRLLMYLVFTSRKREDPLHVISLGSSGTGKTQLQSGVGELIPAEDVILITSLSENAFYYFGKQELKHKLILREQKKDESTGEVYIETTVADIKAANQLMSEVLLRKSDELPGGSRNYHEGLKQHLQQQLKDSFTNRMISKELHMPISTVKRHNFMLFQAGYLTKQRGTDRTGNYRPFYIVGRIFGRSGEKNQRGYSYRARLAIPR